MSYIATLSTLDFVNNGTNVCLKKPGMFLLMVKQNGCPGCVAFEPAFRNILRTFPGLPIGMINVSDQPEFLNITNRSTTRIGVVPFFIFYSDGLPLGKCDNVKKTSDLYNFVKNLIGIAQRRAAQSSSVSSGSIVSGGPGSTHLTPPTQYQQPAPRPQEPPQQQKEGYQHVDFIPYNRRWISKKNT